MLVAGAAPPQKKPKTRKLWGDGKGKFRTKGRYSAATVRGTKWLVTDGCRYTRTRVTAGRRDRPRRRCASARSSCARARPTPRDRGGDRMHRTRPVRLGSARPDGEPSHSRAPRGARRAARECDRARGARSPSTGVRRRRRDVHPRRPCSSLRQAIAAAEQPRRRAHDRASRRGRYQLTRGPLSIAESSVTIRGAERAHDDRRRHAGRARVRDRRRRRVTIAQLTMTGGVALGERRVPRRQPAQPVRHRRARPRARDRRAAPSAAAASPTATARC